MIGRTGIVVAGVLLLAAGPVAPQTAGVPAVEAFVMEDTIRVGDVVPVGVRVVVGPGDRVLLPDTLDLPGDDLENAARARVLVDTLADGTVRVTGLYAVTPWRPGSKTLPAMDVQVVDMAGRSRSATLALPTLDVQSVLPADPDLLDPMPAKGVLGPSFPWWLFPLVGLAILAVGAGAWWWLWRRRKTRPDIVVAPAPLLPPRAAALAALEEARTGGYIERREWKEFYTRVSHALREYLEAVAPGWGADLTTTELLERVRQDMGDMDAGELAGLLQPADQVKFARRVPDAADAHTEWEAARRWVETFQGPGRSEPAAPAEAAA